MLAVGDSSIAARFGNALEIAGFEVVVVTCGADAICVCAQQAPDVLVCDADLPDDAASLVNERISAAISLTDLVPPGDAEAAEQALVIARRLAELAPDHARLLHLGPAGGWGFPRPAPGRWRH